MNADNDDNRTKPKVKSEKAYETFKQKLRIFYAIGTVVDRIARYFVAIAVRMILLV